MSLATALKPHILVVDDDDRLRALLRRYLVENGFIVTTAASAEAARGRLTHLAYDLMVLDVMMPGETGLVFLQTLRHSSAKPLPVLMLTALGESEHRITGLEVGADDYLSKPFEPRELVLRINAILRRLPKPEARKTVLCFGDWHYDLDRDELRKGNETQRLTDTEASLMKLLAAEPGITLSREALAERSKGTISERAIDVQVTRLRRKIETDVKNPRYLITVRGEGYRLMPDETP